MNQARVVVAIVNFRTADLVAQALRSLEGERAATGDFRVCVVDNASEDGSVEKLRELVAAQSWGEWVEVRAQASNRGFSAGNNAAVRPLLQTTEAPDYFLLLNPDTIARPGAVSALLAFMDANPSAGIAGSRLEDHDGTPQRSAFRFHSIFGEINGSFRLGALSRLLSRWVVAPPSRDEVHPCDWVSGASMMVRREVFEEVGLMDEEYFLYFEEVDFCRRALRAGWSCYYVPESRVVHLVSEATGVSKRSPETRRPEYWFASRQRYLRKHHGTLYTACADLIWIVGYATWRVRRRLQGKRDPDPPGLLTDFARNSLFVKRASR